MTRVLGILLAASTAYAQPSPSLDDWMTITSVRSFGWSPDGASLYFTRDTVESGTVEIFHIASDGGDAVRLSKNEPNVRPEPKQQMTLSRDGRTIFFTSARYFQNYTNLFLMSAETAEVRRLTFNDALIESAPAPAPDGKTLAYFAHTRQGTKVFLLELDEPHAWPRLLEPGEDQERFPVWSPDGTTLAFIRGGDIWLKSMADGSTKRLVEPAHAGGNGSPVWSPDGSRIAFLTSKSGYAQVGVAEVETAEVQAITFVPRQHSDIAWSPDGSTLVFVESTDSGLSRHIVKVSVSGKERVQLTQGKGMRQSPQFSPDGRAIAYIESTPTRTADLWKMPAAGGAATQVTSSMGRIDSAALSNPEDASYPGPDRLPVPTLVYKPKDFDSSRKYPVIVRLHGHPGQWNHSFYPEWQYFAQKGFVIAAPNPRGSRGFGAGFHDLHIADYGGTEFDDVLGVLDFLRELGYVDMTRKATWGGSGGGYMSLVIATEAPRAFEAQVIRAPVSSWKLLAIDRFGASGRAWTATRTPRRERSEFGGAYAEIPEEYDRRSPLNFAENVEVPQLLFHGLRDSSVLPRQSQVWVERLKSLGKGELIDYVEYPDEDHGLRRYKTTVRDRLERMERFFREHLKLPERASSQ